MSLIARPSPLEEHRLTARYRAALEPPAAPPLPTRSSHKRPRAAAMLAASSSSLHPATRAIHEGNRPCPTTGAILQPLIMSTTFEQRRPGSAHSALRSHRRSALCVALSEAEASCPPCTPLQLPATPMDATGTQIVKHWKQSWRRSSMATQRTPSRPVRRRRASFARPLGRTLTASRSRASTLVRAAYHLIGVEQTDRLLFVRYRGVSPSRGWPGARLDDDLLRLRLGP